MTLVRLDALPKHCAIIMDGNGRWATQRGLSRAKGHRAGSEAVRRTVRTCRRLGIETLTLFAFSSQNWLRPPTEVAALMGLFREFLIGERDEIIRTGIRVRPIGRVEQLPRLVRGTLNRLVADTAHLEGMTLQLAVSYGGREEIADAAKSVARAVAAGEIRPEDVDETLLESHMPSAAGGPVDLLIRTSGEQRISNFMLWGAAYAELYFTEALWPDFDEAELYRAIAAYQQRDRRFGLVGDNDPDDSTKDEAGDKQRVPSVHV